MRPRSNVHESLYRALISKLDKMELEPGDFIVATFPERVYSSDWLLKDAQRFAEQVASLTRHQVIIVKEGVRLSVHDPKSSIMLPWEGPS
jgi:hypothetical protein